MLPIKKIDQKLVNTRNKNLLLPNGLTKDNLGANYPNPFILIPVTYPFFHSIFTLTFALEKNIKMEIPSHAKMCIYRPQSEGYITNLA